MKDLSGTKQRVAAAAGSKMLDHKLGRTENKGINVMGSALA